MRQHAIVISTVTDEHVSAETWMVTEQTAVQLRAMFGCEPDTRQLLPIEATDELIRHRDHISY